MTRITNNGKNAIMLNKHCLKQNSTVNINEGTVE